MSLLEKLKKNSTIKETAILSESKFFTKKDSIPLPVPALNIALCGSLNGGFYPGLTLFCGPSKHFKSMFSLIMAKAYMDKYEDAVCVFYDCEFGTPEAYFDSLGMDKSRIIHTPIMNMEEFKFDVMNHLQNIARGDHVVFVVDSLGNMSSKKEMEDAIEGKSVQDMSRAKQMKSLFRMITPYLVKYDIPMVAVNHIYMCGTEDQLVMTENGPMSLADIVPGTIVQTTQGLEPVTNIFTYDDAYVSDIELEDGTILSFTQGHRFMVNGEWVFVEDLRVGMELDVLGEKKLRIVGMKFNTRKEKVYDIETPTHDYILSNGVISHNTQEMFSKPVVSGGCLEKGTKILLADRTEINIEDVSVGMKVLTLDGSRIVSRTWNPDTLAEGEPECYKVTFDDGTSVVCSDTHEFLINGSWVEAKDLSLGDVCDVI